MTAVRKARARKEERSVFAGLGAAAAAISLPDFHLRLLDAVGDLLDDDIRSMMRYSRFSAPDFLANNSFGPDFVAHYENEFYRYDPYYRYWKQTEAPGVLPLSRAATDWIDRNRYVNFVLTEAGITDEVCIFLPPVGGSSITLFYDRCGRRFSNGDIALLEEVYPLLAGLHQAHVGCLMAGFCRLDGAAALPEARPIRILDRAGQEVFQNAAWQRLAAEEPDKLGQALARLGRAGSGQAVLEPGLILHRAPLPPAFGLAPGGVVDTAEHVGLAPAEPGQPTLPAKLIEALTRREQEIVELMLQGYPTKSIAEKLDLSRGTVKNYRQRIYDKLDITTEREIFLSFIAASRRA
jgi:DNA-binding CsgD family transcriptional regulator